MPKNSRKDTNISVAAVGAAIVDYSLLTRFSVRFTCSLTVFLNRTAVFLVTCNL